MSVDYMPWFLAFFYVAGAVVYSEYLLSVRDIIRVASRDMGFELVDSALMHLLLVLFWFVCMHIRWYRIEEVTDEG